MSTVAGTEPGCSRSLALNLGLYVTLSDLVAAVCQSVHTHSAGSGGAARTGTNPL